MYLMGFDFFEININKNILYEEGCIPWFMKYWCDILVLEV